MVRVLFAFLLGLGFDGEADVGAVDALKEVERIAEEEVGGDGLCACECSCM